jgi:hypothetical protein
MSPSRPSSPDDESHREDGEPEGSRPVRWELPGLRMPSAESIASRFDELIHRRWEAALAKMESGTLVFEEDLWLELDLPGVQKSEIRVRLELRREGGRLRARVRTSEKS